MNEEKKIEEKKVGIWTNGEQDQAILDLMKELKLTNNELKHTNENLEKAFRCYEKTDNEIREIREKIIPPIYEKLSTHDVWIKILSTAVLGGISAYVANLFR